MSTLKLSLAELLRQSDVDRDNRDTAQNKASDPRADGRPGLPVEAAAEMVPTPDGLALTDAEALPTSAASKARIAELARLPSIDYERVREAAAQALGFRVAILDAEVRKASNKAAPDDEAAMFPEITPWPEPVNGAALLTDIGEAIRRHVIADQATIVAASLWALHTYLLDSLTVSPIAHISAPELRCGKTVLLSVLGMLAWRPIQAANLSPAATFRAIEKWSPTLLIDEADSFLRDNEELRGVLNSGHTRQSAFVIRCVGDEFEPHKFPTWGAKALAGIGTIAPTLADRSIPLVLRRKLPGEIVAILRHAAPGEWGKLRAKILRWTQDHAAEIGAARPAALPGLGDRANDNWEPLLAIADAAGGQWPKLARDAAILLCGHPDTEGAGDELLAAIRDVFEHQQTDRLPTAALVESLCADLEGPWQTWNHGKPISPRQIARKLADYKIKPGNMRLPNGCVPKGYVKDDFIDAWKRYLPAATPHLSATPPQPNGGAASGAFLSATRADAVADEKPLKPNGDATCSLVADKTPVSSEEVDF